MAEDAPHPLDRQVRLLDEWVKTRREIAALEAKAAALLSERAGLLDDDIAALSLHRKAIQRSMVNEYATAGHLTSGAVEHAFSEARMLADFPALRDAFAAGRVTQQHVSAVLQASAPVLAGIHDGGIEPSVLGLFEAAALEFAETETAARTRVHVRELAAALAPEAVVEQNRRGEKERRVWMRSFDDGVSILHVILPTATAAAILDRTRAIAREALDASDPSQAEFALPVDWDAEFAAWQATQRAVTTGTVDMFVTCSSRPGDPDQLVTSVVHDTIFDDPRAAAAYETACDAAVAAGPCPVQVGTAPDDRTLDQVQADVLCDLLLGAEPTEVIGSGLSGIRARVQVSVNATTLAGLDDRPALLDGHGPIDPDVARALAGHNNGWTRLFLSPDGMVTSTDTYTPTAGMRRFLTARDQHCRFPGCRQPVHRCELDHTRDYALGGPTDIRNLAWLCPTHHVLKHPDIPERHRWTAAQRPDGTIEWTSPSARPYVDTPPKRVMFVPSDPAPPPPESRAAVPPWES